MLWTEEQRRALGVNKKEQQLLDALYKKGVLNTMELAFEAKVPRVTAMRLLKILRERGFVARQTLLNEVRWSLVRPELHIKRLQKIFTDMPGTSAKNALPLSDIASVSVYRGAHELLESNRAFFAGHPGERLYAIEPNGIWKHFAKVPQDEWVHVNKILKQKKIIVELIVEADYKKSLTHVKESLQDSFLDLAAETYLVPPGALHSSTEICIFRDSALLLDWEQLVGVEIKNPSTVHLLKGMFTLLKSQSRRI
jgi:DNA-binding MarR family transcriptional regulator